MFSEFLLFVFFVGIAVIGAWETAQIRHNRQTNHKRHISHH